MKPSQPPNRLGRWAAFVLVAMMTPVVWGQSMDLASPVNAMREELVPSPSGVAGLYRLPDSDDQPPSIPTATEELVVPAPLTEFAPPVKLPNPIPTDIFEQATKALELEASRPAMLEPNLGTERVAFAPFEIEVAHPQDVTRIRFDAAFGMNHPDRSEYFWQQISDGGPSWSGRAVNFQELRVYSERVSGESSAFIELPLRWVQPLDARNHTGIGDLQIGAKSLLFKGDDFFQFPTSGNRDDSWRLSGVLRNYINLSPNLGKRGLSTGHFTMEPGLLASYKLSDYKYFHGELKYSIPLGATPEFAGNVLKWGVGMSHVYSFTAPDVASPVHFAIIPTLEVVGWQFRNGRQTNRYGTSSASGITVINIQPGVRIPMGKDFEMGISGAARLTGQDVYDSLVRFEWRWIK